MRNVLIVEDNIYQREELVKETSELDSQCLIFSTDSYKEALEIAGNNKIDVFLIDVKLVDGSGIELAKKLRLVFEYKFTPIIFVTSVATNEMEAFHDIHCYDYIIKPFSKDKFNTVMKNILVDYYKYISNCEDKFIILDFKGLKQKVALADICYIEHRNRKIIIVTKDDIITYKHLSINRFMACLDDGFVQIHQSFVVNKTAIERVDFNNNTVKLIGLQELIPIGIKYHKKAGELINGII